MENFTKGGITMEWEDCKLRRRIRQKFCTEKNFAEAIGMNKSTLSLRLNKKISWKVDEIQRIIKFLEISTEEIPSYFFSEASEAK